jgi:hypothetical protein
MVFTLLCPLIYGQLYISPSLRFLKQGFQTEGLNTFKKSYNDYYALGMKNPFDMYGNLPQTGFQYGVDIVFMKEKENGFFFRSGLLFSNSKSVSSCTIWNNYRNDIVLKFHDWQVPADIGYSIKGIVAFYLAMDISMRKTRLEYWQYYPDGSKSVGNEFDMNGVYTATVPVFNYGGGMVLRYKRFTIPVRYTLGRTIFNVEKVPLTDYDANQFRSNSFPLDYSKYQSDILGEDQDNAIFKDEMGGGTFTIGINYLIPITK